MRKAAQRARARVALLAAEHFGLQIPTTIDLCSYDSVKIGVPVVDTIDFNIQPGGDDQIEFYSACCDTTAVQNGIIMRMHQSEGYWIFRWALKSSDELN